MIRLSNILALIALASAISGASASPLIITPTTLTLQPGTTSGVIEITNASDQPTNLQFRAYRWEQPDGRDTLSPTNDLVISPPIATVAPRSKQVFRIIRIASSTHDEMEPAYRLRLNELPQAGNTNAVAINFEFSLPVFFPQVGASPSPNWSFRNGTVTVHNSGTLHLRFNDVFVRDGDGSDIPIARTAYVLPGSTRVFSLPSAVRAPRSLVAVTEAGPTSVPINTLAAR